MIKQYSSLSFTILFVDGNHENFTLLNSYPIEEWHGGKVHKLNEPIRKKFVMSMNKTYYRVFELKLDEFHPIF